MEKLTNNALFQTPKCIFIKDNTIYEGTAWHIDRVATAEEIRNGEFMLGGYHLKGGNNPHTSFNIKEGAVIYELDSGLQKWLESKTNAFKLNLYKLAIDNGILAEKKFFKVK